MSTDNHPLDGHLGIQNAAGGLVFDRTRLPVVEDVQAKLVEVGFEVSTIDLLEGDQLWKISMRPGRVTTNDKKRYVVYLVTKTLEELVPEMTPQDVGANIAGGRITVGILWPGERKGRVLVGKDHVLASWCQ